VTGFEQAWYEASADVAGRAGYESSHRCQEPSRPESVTDVTIDPICYNDGVTIPRDLVLENARVRLEPLGFRHAGDFFAAGRDAEVWSKTFRGHQMPSMEATLRYIGEAIYGDVTSPGGVPFAIVDKATQKAIGGTRYFDISEADRRLEIGWTWLSRDHWRSHVNTSCKYLLLQYAFEEGGFNRVQFKADSENDRSRAAIVRIGAAYEGTFRDVRHFGDSMRSVSCYSILAREWPAVKERLFAALTESEAS
jgi:N-acetyltransferase